MNGFSGFDIAIALIVLYSLYRGFKVGLIESLVGLVGWFATLYMGTHFARSMGGSFAGVVKDPVLQTALAFLVIVLLMLMIVWGFSIVLKSLINALALTPIEKLAGGVFGAARGVLIVLVIMSFIGSWASKESWWQESILARPLTPYAPLAMNVGKGLATTAWDELLPPKHDKSKSAGKTESQLAANTDSSRDPVDGHAASNTPVIRSSNSKSTATD
jgi:membrane protein required for colicin V production